MEKKFRVFVAKRFLLLPRPTKVERVYGVLRRDGGRTLHYVVTELGGGDYAVFTREEFMREWEEYRGQLPYPWSLAMFKDVPQFTRARVVHATFLFTNEMANAEVGEGERRFVIIRGQTLAAPKIALAIKRPGAYHPELDFITEHVMLPFPDSSEQYDALVVVDDSHRPGYITEVSDGVVETTLEGLKEAAERGDLPGDLEQWRDVRVRAGESVRTYHRLTDEEMYQRLWEMPKEELVRLLARGKHAGFVDLLEGEGNLELGLDLHRTAKLSGIDDPFCGNCGSTLIDVSRNANKVILTSTNFSAPRARIMMDVEKYTGRVRGGGTSRSIPKVAPDFDFPREPQFEVRPEIAPEVRPTIRHEVVPEVAPEAMPGMATEPVTKDASDAEKPESTGVMQRRWVNVALEGEGASKILQVGKVYTLCFDVDVMVRAASIVEDVEFVYDYEEGEEGVELEIHLSSQDFRIYDDRQKLYVPRAGRSENKARFDIKPLHDGKGTLRALILKDNNFIQELTLTLEVGRERDGVVEVESKGRPPEAMAFVKPRDVHIDVSKSEKGFELKFISGFSANATLKGLTPEAVDEMSKGVRAAWEKIVKTKGKGQLPYQTGVDIPASTAKTSLKSLAEEGYLLYQKIFYENQDNQTQAMGNLLRKIALNECLHIQITSDKFFLPWSVLYTAPNLDKVQPEMFLGLKHIIEHIPKQENFTYFDLRMDGRPKFSVSLNIDEGIDNEAAAKGVKPVVKEQVDFWDRLKAGGNVTPVVRRESKDLLEVLRNNSIDERLIYFYCHAGSRQEKTPPYIKLSDGKRLGVNDFIMAAGGALTLRNAPLVFINACESAELSPFFYDDFLNYLVSKGARGAIGTECKIPAVFASEWAKRFFTRFLPGKSLGKLLLELRREFFFEHNNLLGLAYALYCDGDTQILPGLEVNQDSSALPEAQP